MKFKEIEFENRNCTRIYRDYLKRVRNTVKILNEQNQQEILLEINSHLFEGFSDNPNGRDEVEHLLDILEKLGQPEEFLKPLIANKKLEEATRTFNPLEIVKALTLNISNGISYIIFAILYLFLFGFLFLIIAKLIDRITWDSFIVQRTSLYSGNIIIQMVSVIFNMSA
ncbi:HAAS signaling domain-containing protein [Sphingobacterium sp. IITKGP-BTPF85]|uniref:HAAS signaling domain-containing protein n=1 Tax=Sphingobacterium sp. IITKGP-BTPF85 TaxID=1338009 RepID=UPI00038A50C1|nr:DUF1700 domain-containing protein [Sphingobacterium sp. IITKGP-BTPF85]KKX47194.1 hypothetical protein L950_0227785 [Sphingobacterium sp. IITKGP-BTPF85]